MNQSTGIRSIVDAFTSDLERAIAAEVKVMVANALQAAFAGTADEEASIKVASGYASAIYKGDPITPRGRKKASRTPALAKARKLQGQYLGSLRSLSERDRARAKAAAKKGGVAAGLAMARSLHK